VEGNEEKSLKRVEGNGGKRKREREGEATQAETEKVVADSDRLENTFQSPAQVVAIL
jgi:hypothetical protein